MIEVTRESGVQLSFEADEYTVTGEAVLDGNSLALCGLRRSQHNGFYYTDIEIFSDQRSGSIEVYPLDGHDKPAEVELCGAFVHEAEMRVIATSAYYVARATGNLALV